MSYVPALGPVLPLGVLYSAVQLVRQRQCSNGDADMWYRIVNIMVKRSRAHALDRIQLLSRHIIRSEDEMFPYEESNPCEICKRITLGSLASGYMHRNFAGLVESSSRGCNLCTLLKLACFQTQGRDNELSETSIQDAEQQILGRLELEGQLDIPVQLRCTRSNFSDNFLSEVVQLTWKSTDGPAIIGLYKDNGMLQSMISWLLC
jgi:hypothetical protein